MPNGEIQVGIYRVDKSLFEESLPTENIVDEIVEKQNSRVSSAERWEVQPLRPSLDFGDLKVRIYSSVKFRTPKWMEFIGYALDEEAPMRRKRNTDVSYIAFIWDTNNLFAISGGQGNFVVQNYIEQHFGTDILCRIIEEDNKVIRSLQERVITGTTMASTKFFRGDRKLSDEDEFGKIYKQLRAELSSDIMQREFGFTAEEVRKKSGCIAKSSFQISKSIEFPRLLEIAKKIVTIANRQPRFVLNKVQEITRKTEKGKRLIESLETALFAQLHDLYIGRSSYIDFDLCHENFESFRTADHYHVYRGSAKRPFIEGGFDELTDIVPLFEQLRSHDEFDGNDIDDFKKNLKGLRIRSFDGDGKMLTEDPLLKHLHAEVNRTRSGTYFCIDGCWYEIKNDFVDDLNRQCQEIIGSNNDDVILSREWGTAATENAYNRQYIGDANTIVLDRVVPENIELCDILRYDERTVTLIHVKQRFSNSMRDLASQVYIAAKRLHRDMKSNPGFSYVKKLHERLHSSTSDEYLQSVYAQVRNQSCNDFIDIFRNKKIIAVLAFVDINDGAERSIQNITDFGSNIAKFSIFELHRNLRTLNNVEFKVVQIPRT